MPQTDSRIPYHSPALPRQRSVNHSIGGFLSENPIKERSQATP